MSDNILIRNNKPRIIYLTATAKDPKARLVPGVNSVPTDLWGKLKKDPCVQAMLKRQGGKLAVLEEVRGADDLGKTVKPKSVTDLSVGDAESVIAETVDVELLKRWLKEEESAKARKGVLRALEAQLEEMKLDAKKE